MARPKLDAPTGKKLTWFMPFPVIESIEDRWRDHVMLDGSRCSSKSAYIADLVLRDSAAHKSRPKKRA